MLLQFETPVLIPCEVLPARRCWTATGLHIEGTFGDVGDIAGPGVAPNGEESKVLDCFSNPQSKHSTPCLARFSTTHATPWQSPQFCKL
jgi:hypothetical protein